MLWEVPNEARQFNANRTNEVPNSFSRFNNSFKEVYDIPQEVEMLQSALIGEERSAFVSMHNRIADVRWTRYFLKNSAADLNRESFNDQVQEKADFTDARFPFIPEGLKSYTSLRYLNLARNLIKTWPEFMFVRPNIRYQQPPFDLVKLNIRENLISEIPEAVVKGWRSLEELDISFNLLTNVAHIHLATNLKLLRLERNPITELPGSFIALERLEFVSIDWSEAVNPLYKYIIVRNPVWGRYLSESLSLTSLLESIRRYNQTKYPFDQFFSDFNQQHSRYLIEPRLLSPFITKGKLFDAKRITDAQPDLLAPERLMSVTKIGLLDDLIELDLPRQVHFLFNTLPESPAKASLGSKCILRALERAKSNVLLTLHEFSFDPDWRDHQGNTLLHYALQNYEIDYDVAFAVTRELLKGGCDPNALNSSGEPPLRKALPTTARAQCHNVLIAAELTKAIRYGGFNLTDADGKGNSVLHLLCKKPNISIMHSVINIVPDLILSLNSQLLIAFDKFPSSFLTSKKLVIDVLRRAVIKMLRTRGPVHLEADVIHDINYTPSTIISNYSTSIHVGIKKMGQTKSRIDHTSHQMNQPAILGLARGFSNSFVYDEFAPVPEELTVEMRQPQVQRVPAYDYHGFPQDESNMMLDQYTSGLRERNNASHYYKAIFDLGKALSDKARTSHSNSIIGSDSMSSCRSHSFLNAGSGHIAGPIGYQDASTLTRLNKDLFCLEFAEQLMKKGANRSMQYRHSFPKKFMEDLNNPQRGRHNSSDNGYGRNPILGSNEYLFHKAVENKQSLWLLHLFKHMANYQDGKSRMQTFFKLAEAFRHSNTEFSPDQGKVVNSRAAYMELLSRQDIFLVSR